MVRLPTPKAALEIRLSYVGPTLARVILKQDMLVYLLHKEKHRGGYHPKWGNPITKEHIWYALTDKWAQKLRKPKIQFLKPMKLNNKEDQSLDTSILLRRGNRGPMEGVTETKFGAKTKGMTIQKLTHLGNHPINNQQTQTLLQMSTRACWQETNIAVSWEALPVPN